MTKMVKAPRTFFNPTDLKEFVPGKDPSAQRASVQKAVLFNDLSYRINKMLDQVVEKMLEVATMVCEMKKETPKSKDLSKQNPLAVEGTNDPDFDNGQDIINYLRELFSSLALFNGGNLDFNKIMIALAKIEQMLKNPEKYHITEKQAQYIKNCLNGNNIVAKGMSLAEFLVYYLAAQAYGKGKGSWDAVLAELKALKKIFGDEDSSSIGFIKKILDTIKLISIDKTVFISELYRWKLVDKDGNIINQEDFEDIIKGKLDTFMSESNFDKVYKHQVMENLLKYFVETYGYLDKNGKFHWKNPDLVFFLLMTAVMNPSMDIAQSSIGGMDGTEKKLSQFEDLLSDLMHEISGFDGNKQQIDGNTAKDLITKLYQLVNRLGYDKGRFGSILDNIKKSLSSIIDDPDIRNNYSKQNWDKIAEKLNSKLKEDPSCLRDALSSAAGILSNQSSVLKGIMDQKTADIKTATGTEKNILDAIAKLLEFITNKMNTA